MNTQCAVRQTVSIASDRQGRNDRASTDALAVTFAEWALIDTEERDTTKVVTRYALAFQASLRGSEELYRPILQVYVDRIAVLSGIPRDLRASNLWFRNIAILTAMLNC